MTLRLEGFGKCEAGQTAAHNQRFHASKPF
jgi:hypothetical protein